MLKVMGVVMIFSGCLGLGVWYSRRLTGRVEALRLLETILELLASEVRYGRATLPECCRHAALQLPPAFSVAMEEVDKKMQTNDGDTFAAVFRECMREPLCALPLREEDRENFLGFASGAGYMDSRMQLRTLERSRELLESTTKRLQKENIEKCRVAVGLGAMGGLFLILILW